MTIYVYIYMQSEVTGECEFIAPLIESVIDILFERYNTRELQ